MDSCLTNTDAHVVSGSEDGRVFFWDLVDGSVAKSFKAHQAVVRLLCLLWQTVSTKSGSQVKCRTPKNNSSDDSDRLGLCIIRVWWLNSKLYVILLYALPGYTILFLAWLYEVRTLAGVGFFMRSPFYPFVLISVVYSTGRWQVCRIIPQRAVCLHLLLMALSVYGERDIV